jgi:hypothetical protein
MSHLILNPSNALVIRPGGVNLELPTNPFTNQLHGRRNRLTRLKLPAVTALVLALFVLAAALPRPCLAAPGTWSAIAPMANPRMFHTATKIDYCNNVVVAGGQGFNGVKLNSAEVYWVYNYFGKGGTWESTPTDNYREYHTASYFHDSVYLLGGMGYSNGGIDLDVLLWPIESSNGAGAGWYSSSNYNMNKPRSHFTSTVVTANVTGPVIPFVIDSCILSVGGYTYGNGPEIIPTATAELLHGYNVDPIPVPPMHSPHAYHTPPG